MRLFMNAWLSRAATHVHARDNLLLAVIACPVIILPMSQELKCQPRVRKTWFTADTHFGHANIMKYCNRPFTSVEDMDAELIVRWNMVVQPGDTVWHIGDFNFHGKGRPLASHYLSALNGDKHLIWGNHDRQETRKASGWASSRAYAEVCVDDTDLVLFHYGMRVWNRSHHGIIHLYGHSHGTLPGDGGSLDVGVDCWDFQPVGLDVIKMRLATLPPRPAYPPRLKEEI